MNISGPEDQTKICAPSPRPSHPALLAPTLLGQFMMSSSMRPTRSRRILLVGSAVALFRDALHLARDTRPDWFFEVAACADAAARMLDDHDVDAIVAGLSQEGSLVLDEAEHPHPSIHRVAVLSLQHFRQSDGKRHDASIDATATVDQQLAMLDSVLAQPEWRRTA